jgi:hypothetical protein
MGIIQFLYPPIMRVLCEQIDRSTHCFQCFSLLEMERKRAHQIEGRENIDRNLALNLLIFYLFPMMVMVFVFRRFKFYIKINCIEFMLKPWPGTQVSYCKSEFELQARINM